MKRAGFMVVALVMAMIVAGCALVDVKDAIKERASMEIEKTHAHFSRPEVKQRVLEEARVELESRLEETKARTLEVFDQKAPGVYDGMVDAMLNPGLLGYVAGGLGIALKLVIGTGII